MASSASASVPTAMSCNRCGGSIHATFNASASYDTFYVYCSPCSSLMSQEILSYKKKAESMDKELKTLRDERVSHDFTLTKLKNRADFIEKSYTDEAIERLEIRTQRDWARNAIMYWKSFLDHWKVKTTCQFCSALQPCPTMKLIEEQALSATPGWECDRCKGLDAQCAVMKSAMNSWVGFQGHFDICGTCANNRDKENICYEHRDSIKTLSARFREAEDTEAGSRLIAELTNVIKTFSYLGEGSAILYEGGTYQVIKLDVRKVKTEDISFISVANTPKAALDKAKIAQKSESMQHA